MANSFNKNEIVAFEQVFEGFEDALVVSKAFSKYEFPGIVAERTGNIIWRPQPYIAQSFTGVDQTANFNRTYTQLSVPATLGYSHSVPLTLSSTELRDLLQSKRLGQAAMQRLASDINVDCSNLAALTGSLFVKRTAAAAGFDDLAACDNIMNRTGVPMSERQIFLASADYNSMASNLASRTLDNSKSLTAYERAYVGNICGFDTRKADYSYRLALAAGVTVTVNGSNQYYTPKSVSVASTGEQNNVDNRFQTLPISVTSGTVKVGDAFTIAGVNEVHHITKQDTGNLKTFRIASIVTGAGGSGNIQITPPIISATGATDAEKQYQNCSAAPASGAAIVFLNTVTNSVNPFWQADAFEIIPGKYEPQEDAGLSVMSSTTESGITVVMTKQATINDLTAKYRWDVFYGLLNKQPEMTGVMMFSQT